MSKRRAIGMLSVAAGAVCLIQTGSNLPISYNFILIGLTAIFILLGLHLLER